MAQYFYDEIGPAVPAPLRISQVMVWETDTTSATYRP